MPRIAGFSSAKVCLIAFFYSNMHLNPDHYLQTKQGRIISPARNEYAWQQCFLALNHAILTTTIQHEYVLIGCQASGKSTWAKQHLLTHPNDLVFDAILVKISERKPILALLKTAKIPCTAVWFQTPLEHCLARNALRPLDERVNEQGLKNVYNALEAPTHQEGFNTLIIVPCPVVLTQQIEQ